MMVSCTNREESSQHKLLSLTVHSIQSALFGISIFHLSCERPYTEYVERPATSSSGERKQLQGHKQGSKY